MIARLPKMNQYIDLFWRAWLRLGTFSFCPVGDPHIEGMPINTVTHKEKKMPFAELEFPFNHIRGAIGKVVYRKRNGKTIVALRPDSDRPLSEAEVAHRQDFTRAAAWATTALKNVEMRQTYQ